MQSGYLHGFLRDRGHVLVVRLPLHEPMLCLMPGSEGNLESRLLKNIAVVDFIQLKLPVNGMFVSSVDQ